MSTIIVTYRIGSSKGEPIARRKVEKSPKSGGYVSINNRMYKIVQSGYDYEMWQFTGDYIYDAVVEATPYTSQNMYLNKMSEKTKAGTLKDYITMMTEESIMKLFRDAVGNIDIEHPRTIVTSQCVPNRLTNRCNKETSFSSFLNVNKLRMAFHYAYPQKNTIGRYDAICLCLLFVTAANKDYDMSLFLCDEILQTTKNEEMRVIAQEEREIFSNCVRTKNMKGFSLDVLNHISNPADFEKFLSLSKECTRAYLQDISLNGSSVRIRLVGDSMVGMTEFASLSIDIQFDDVKEFTNNRIGNNEIILGYSFDEDTRMYIDKEYIIFEVCNFYGERIFYVKSGKIKCHNLWVRS